MKILLTAVLLTFSAFANAKTLYDFLGCYKALQYQGADVVPADFPSDIGLERDSVMYKSLEGKDIPTIKVRAAVLKVYGQYYQAAEFLLTKNTTVTETNTHVLLETEEKVLSETGKVIVVKQKLFLSEENGTVNALLSDNIIGKQEFLFQQQSCQ